MLPDPFSVILPQELNSRIWQVANYLDRALRTLRGEVLLQILQKSGINLSDAAHLLDYR